MTDTDTLSTAGDGTRFRFALRCAEPVGVLDDIARLAECCAPFLDGEGADPEETNAVQTALEELLTNVAKFGAGGTLPSSPPLEAEGEVEVGAETIRLVLADNGLPFDPSGRAPPDLEEDVESRPVGGLGLYMLFLMFDRHEYRRADGRNVNVWTLDRRKGQP